MKKAAIIVSWLALAAMTVVAGPKIEINDDSWLQISVLGQVHYSFLDNSADVDDFYLRRGRIILSGQMTDGVKFFMETDNDNAGKHGMSVSTDIQDASMDLRIYESENAALWVQTGLILLPFSLENKASAASLLGLDYNSETCGKFVNTFVWRDTGAEIHGHVGGIIGYRAGVFDGYDDYVSGATMKNEEAALRYTGHVVFNVLGDTVEKGDWFSSQNRLGKNKYLVVGFGADSQKNATMTTVTGPAGISTNQIEDNASAWVADFQSSLPIGDKAAILVNGGYYKWDNAVFDGTTMSVEAGVLYDKVMLTGKCSMEDPDGNNRAETKNYTAGLHYFIKGHNVRTGIEYRWGDSDDWTLAGIQFLL